MLTSLAFFLTFAETLLLYKDSLPDFGVGNGQVGPKSAIQSDGLAVPCLFQVEGRAVLDGAIAAVLLSVEYARHRPGEDGLCGRRQEGAGSRLRRHRHRQVEPVPAAPPEVSG